MESRSRTILRRNLASLLLLSAFCLLIFDLPLGLAQTPSARTQIEAGKRLYAGSCGMSYCHGSEGIGGGGPKLRGREFSPEYLTFLITEGVPGTIMPGFKNGLSKQQIAQVVAYLISMSPSKGAAKPESGQPAPVADPHLNNPAPKTEAAPKPPPEAAPSTVVTNDSADLRGDAEAGRLLFFDSAEIQNCRVCHTVQDRGGKVGPDLTALANRSPREILQSIVAPHSRIDEKYITVVITTRSGERFAGVKRDENETMIRLYDTSSLPPVSRAFAKSEVAKVEKLNTSAMPADYASRYSFKQLLDLVSFLKSADPARPANVSLKDLF
jgi:putative heme-binding domain-containing protein